MFWGFLKLALTFQTTNSNPNRKSRLWNKPQAVTTRALAAQISVVLSTNRKTNPGTMIFLHLLSNKNDRKLVCLQQTIRERRMFFKIWIRSTASLNKTMLWNSLYFLPISENSNSRSHNTEIQNPALTQLSMSQESKTLCQEILRSMRVPLIFKSAIHVEGHLILLRWASTPRFVKKFSLRNGRNLTSKSNVNQLMRAAKGLKIKIMEDGPSNSLKWLLLRRRKVTLKACQSGRFKVYSSELLWVQIHRQGREHLISTLLKRRASRLTIE